MRTTAAVLVDGVDDFRFVPVDTQPLRDDEVLVRVVAAGVCHTDLTCRSGFAAAPRPVVLGHEGAGRVVEVGPAVRDLEPGDDVVLTYWSCGRCPRCRVGDSVHCADFVAGNMSGRRPDGSSPLAQAGDPIGGAFFGQSSFATHCVATERNAVRVPAGSPLHLLAPLGCSGLTGAGTVLTVLRSEPGHRLLVMGAGGVGLCAVMAAAASGLTDITVVEPRAHRREAALAVGATRTLTPEQFAALSADAFDHAVDTTGVPSVVEHLAECVSPGGAIALLTANQPDARMSVRLLSMLRTGAVLRGVRLGGGRPAQMIPELVDLHARGAFPLERIVRTFAFDDIDAAFVAAADGSVIKPVLTFPW